MESENNVVTLPNLTLPADTRQEDISPVEDLMVCRLYRRNKLVAPDLTYYLRIDTPLMYRDGSLFEPNNSTRSPLRKYTAYNASIDILVPADMTMGMVKAIRADSDLVAQREAARSLEDSVKAHPLYQQTANDLAREKAGVERLERELRDGEKLYRVDAILTHFDECHQCDGRGYYTAHYEEYPCFNCRSTGVCHYIWFRLPGDHEADNEMFVDGTNLRDTWREAMAECAKRGWMDVLMPDGKRKRVFSREVAA
jgi:hypothetical protein